MLSSKLGIKVLNQATLLCMAWMGLLVQSALVILAESLHQC